MARARGLCGADRVVATAGRDVEIPRATEWTKATDHREEESSLDSVDPKRTEQRGARREILGTRRHSGPARAQVEEVCELRARYAATPAPPLGGGLAPPDFHEAIWPTWVCGRDAWGHLVVVERLGRVDFDRLLAMPVDAILRLRMDALDALQRRSARPRPGRPRVYKCVFLVDCRDCSYVDVARRETVRVTAAYARLTERMYADAVWKNVIVHAPAVLRATWSLVDPLLDPETRELIAFVGPEDVGAAGVPRRARWPD